MGRINQSGFKIDYQFHDDAGARPLVLTPGARYPKEAAGVPQLAQFRPRRHQLQNLENVCRCQPGRRPDSTTRVRK